MITYGEFMNPIYKAIATNISTVPIFGADPDSYGININTITDSTTNSTTNTVGHYISADSNRTVNYAYNISIPKYFIQENKKNLNELINNLTENDAEKILQKLFEEITKENSDFRLSSEVETALTQMILDKTVGIDD